MVEQILTLHEKLDEVVKLSPHQMVVRERNGDLVRSFTYQEFYQLVEKVASFLLDYGIKNDDKIAIVLENRIEWGCIYFGILKSGAIAVPIDPQASSDDLTFFCENAECKIAFVASGMAEKLATISTPQIKLEKIVALDWAQNREHGKICSFAQVADRENMGTKNFPQRSANDIASILYTSGTTGKYKGVMLTHRNFYANFLSLTKIKIKLCGNHFLALLPLHHSFPFMANLITPLFTGGKVTFLHSLKSDELLKCLQQDGITMLGGVPQLYYMLHKALAAKLKSLPRLVKWLLAPLREIAWILRKYLHINLSKKLYGTVHKAFGQKLRYLFSGGAKLDDAVAIFFLKSGFNFVEGYGLTETAPVITFNLDKIHHLQAAGKPITDVRVKISPSSEVCNGFNVGEILISGPNVMLGYYKNEAATQTAIKDGWFYTGDLGYLDNDGYLYITGRQKEIIVLSSGKNVSPEEVEAHYSKSHFIREICVMESGNENNEKLMAIVVPDIEYCSSIGKVDIYQTIREELELLSKELVPYKRIMGFIITKEVLPRTRLGKLRRFLLKERYAQELNGQGLAKPRTANEGIIDDKDLVLLAHPTAQRVLKILANTQVIDKPIKLDDHLEIDLGLESLSRIDLLMVIEKEFQVKISDEEFSKVATVKELICKIDMLLAQNEDKESVVSTLAEEVVTATAWEKILAVKLSPAMEENIIVTPSVKQKVIFTALHGLLSLFLRVGWRLRIKGTENLPQQGPFILCPNHVSFLDGPAVAAALPAAVKKETFFIGLTDIFADTYLSMFTKTMKIIPIDPGAQLLNAMQACAYVLRQGKVVCIFPEGGRSPDGSIKEFKKGVGILAAELNVPLVPVHIKGAYEAWPRSERFPKLHKVSVTFGQAYSADGLRDAGVKLGANDGYAAIAAGIREKVKELE